MKMKWIEKEKEVKKPAAMSCIDILAISSSQKK
jgi:hypothetical protein